MRRSTQVVADLLRLCGHGEHDDAGYILADLKKSPMGRDCLKIAEDYLLAKKLADAAQIVVWRSEILREIEDTVAQVQREPAPDPFNEDWTAISSSHLSETHDQNGN